MSVRLMSAIFESTSLGPTERLLMLSLADHADDDGRCYPSIQRLCQRTGLGERAVQQNIRKLTEGGYIRVETGGGRARSNAYIISTNPAPAAPIRAENPARETPFLTTNPARETPYEGINPASGALNPARDAPEPSRTTKEVSKREDTRDIERLLGDCASGEAVSSFLRYRRRLKGGALTMTGAKRLAGHLRAIMDSGGDCDDALAMAEEKGWASIEPSWYFKAKGTGHDPRTIRRDAEADRMAAILEAAARGTTRPS